MNALCDFEVSEVIIDLERVHIELKWEKAANRWRKFSTEEIKGASRYVGHAENLLWLRIATADIKCNDPAIQLISLSGIHLSLPNCTLTKLWHCYNGDTRCLTWISDLLHQGKIERQHIAESREDMRSAGKDPDEVLPEMNLRPETVFRLRDFYRPSSELFYKGEYPG